MSPKFRAFKVVPDSGDGSMVEEEISEYYSLPVDKISEMVIAYVSEMETQRTNDWCKCEWLIHPEDVELDVHNCKRCHHPRALHREMEGMNVCTKTVSITQDDEEFHDVCWCGEWVDPPKRRMRRGDTHPLCAVHTKEGFLIGFFEWVFKSE